MIFKRRYTLLLLALVIISLIPAVVTALPGQNLTGPVTIVNKNSFGLMVMVKNSNTGTGISGARVYLDGGFEGTTSGSPGSLTLTSIPAGEHSIRVISRGFLENISMVQVPDEKEVIIPLHPVKVIPIGNQGPVEDRIDVVFVPSKTEYDCTKKEIITTDYYTSNEDNFRNDVNSVIHNDFATLNAKTSKEEGLPANYQDLFNFYYYSDPGDFADAFNGCAGTLPEDFYEDAPFTDVAIIIYPNYGGIYSGSCAPEGCTSSLGLGISTWLKAPANPGGLLTHEVGHAVFGLMDTYCGVTYYAENDPYPNIWASSSACLLAAKENQWNPMLCRQIATRPKTVILQSARKISGDMIQTRTLCTREGGETSGMLQPFACGTC